MEQRTVIDGSGQLISIVDIDPRKGRAAALDQVINRTIESAFEFAQALAELRDRKLYLELGYQTFADYCQTKQGLTDRRVRQMIRSAKVIAEIGTVVPELAGEIKNERTARALAAVPEQDRIIVLEAAIADCEQAGTPLSGAAITRAATDLADDYSLEDVQAMFAPYGEFRECDRAFQKQYRYEFKRHGCESGKKYFTSLKVAVQWLQGEFLPKAELWGDKSETDAWIEETERPIYTTSAKDGSGSDQHPTPEYLWRPALEMWGTPEFDLDPMSYEGCPIPAKQIFTAEDDCFTREWKAQYFWSNPAYSKNLPFARHFAAAYERGDIQNAVILDKQDNRTEWYGILLQLCSAYCLVDHPVKFEGNDSGSFFPSVLLYYGPDVDRFYHAYTHLGYVCQPLNPDMFAE